MEQKEINRASEKQDIPIYDCNKRNGTRMDFFAEKIEFEEHTMSHIEDLQEEVISREELEKGLQRIKMRKVSGSDGIDSEMIKSMRGKGRELFHKL